MQTIRKWLNKFLVKDVLRNDANAEPILKRFGVVRYRSVVFNRQLAWILLFEVENIQKNSVSFE